MAGTGSYMMTCACLPIRRNICQHASTEPIASPSGRAWDVSRKWFLCAISFNTCFNMALLEQTSRPPVQLHMHCTAAIRHSLLFVDSFQELLNPVSMSV